MRNGRTRFSLALEDGRSFRIVKPVVLIGRGSECDIWLDSSDISDFHCCVGLLTDSLVVRDLNSSAGIQINGQTCSEGAVKSGDELSVGNLKFQIRAVRGEMEGFDRKIW